jgi:hypothetical protein
MIISKRRLSLITAGAAIFGCAAGGLVAADASPRRDTTNPTQQQALDANSIERAYIQAHPDVTPSASPSATTTASAGTYASGLPWSDGGWFENDATEAASFQTWRGHHVDNINVYNDRANWSTMLDNGWTAALPSSFNPVKDDLMISLPMWADNGSVTNIGTDAQWKQLATQIVAKDPNAIVRMGWEMNCCYSQATNANATQWKADWARIWTDMKSVGPNLTFAFNVNEGTSGPGLISDPSTLFIPGKMDMVLIDAYDGYPPYSTSSAQNEHQTKKFGWDYWYNFAQSKNVPFGLGEWGVWHVGSNGGNDDPTYINWVYDWLKTKNAAKPGSIRIASYFNYGQDPNQILFPTNTNPKSAAAYLTKVNSLAS